MGVLTIQYKDVAVSVDEVEYSGYLKIKAAMAKREMFTTGNNDNPIYHNPFHILFIKWTK